MSKKKMPEHRRKRFTDMHYALKRLMLIKLVVTALEEYTNRVMLKERVRWKNVYKIAAVYGYSMGVIESDFNMVKGDHRFDELVQNILTYKL